MKDEPIRSPMDEDSWFLDPGVLLLELKKTSMHWGELPRIPGYDRIVEICRGGQGLVYRARQRSTNRTVAVKVLLDGSFASEANRLRFQREIELVGKLRHPHIVRIYDSGNTADRHLYYVMEYIDGVPLNRENLDASGELRRMLQMFMKICDGVRHAHRHGIIHRDLKPNNILYDQNGQPHILDFGLAKVVEESFDDSDEGSSVVSRTGQFLGSLAWASPEQFEKSTDQIDIRTDVYSLGVILYQLLTGRLPHPPSQNLHHTIKAIVSETPPRPRTIRSDVPDDLETVVMHCLAKDPDHRYQSAGELMRDLQHYLKSEPIDAKRHRPGYVLRKYLLRHKAVTGLLFLVLMLVVGFAVTMAVLYPRAVRAEREALKNLETAMTQAAKAEAVRDFLVEIISYSDPFVSQGQELSMRQALDSAAQKVDTRISDHPEIEAEIRAVIGKAYYHLNDLDESEKQDRAALLLLEDAPGAGRLLKARILCNLSLIDLDRRRFEAAEEKLTRARKIVEEEVGKDHEQYADCLHGFASLRQSQFRLEEANQFYREASEIYERWLNPWDHGYIANLMQWAGLLISIRYPDQAVEILDRILATIDEYPQELGIMRSIALFYLGLAQFNMGELEKSKSTLEAALESQEKLFDQEHPKLAEILIQMGHVHREQRAFHKAERHYRRSLEIYLRLAGAESAEYASGLWNVAQILWLQEDYTKAEELFLEALAVRRKIYGPEHHLLGASVTRLGMLFIEIEQWEKALNYMEEAAAIQEEVFGKESPRTARAHTHVGNCLIRLKRYDEAEKQLLPAVDVLQKKPVANQAYLEGVLQTLVDLYGAWGRPDLEHTYQGRLDQAVQEAKATSQEPLRYP